MAERAQCIVHRGNRLLMVRLRPQGNRREFWCLPGGGIEDGETPAEAAVRELGEECGVDGTLVRETSVISRSPQDKNHVYDKVYTFLVDIGDQSPDLGTDPDPGLVALGWLTLAEIPERDRIFLGESGLLGVGDFFAEVFGWGESISYPLIENVEEPK